jgi:hypothetical protein
MIGWGQNGDRRRDSDVLDRRDREHECDIHIYLYIESLGEKGAGGERNQGVGDELVSKRLLLI